MIPNVHYIACGFTVYFKDISLECRSGFKVSSENCSSPGKSLHESKLLLMAFFMGLKRVRN